MTKRYEELITAFEIKLRKLISEYQTLQAHHNKLKDDMTREHESLIRAHSEILELKKKNDHLLLVNQLGGSSENRTEAKKQIDKLVREIDQCLALIDE